MSIKSELLDFACDEGVDAAIDKSEKWHLMLEDLVEIAAGPEVKVVTYLHNAVSEALTELLVLR